MPYCAVLSCPGKEKIHRYPSTSGSNLERRNVWIERTNRMAKDGGPWQPSQSAGLCDAHFEKSQFELHRRDGLKKLKPNALPTLFPQPIGKLPSHGKVGRKQQHVVRTEVDETLTSPKGRKKGRTKETVEKEAEKKSSEEDDIARNNGVNKKVKEYALRSKKVTPANLLSSRSKMQSRRTRGTKRKAEEPVDLVCVSETPSSARKRKAEDAAEPIDLTMDTMRNIQAEVSEASEGQVSEAINEGDVSMTYCESSFKCPLCCSESMTSLLALKCHLEWVMDRLRCPICSDKFVSLRSMVKHLEGHLVRCELSRAQEERCEVAEETTMHEDTDNVEDHSQDDGLIAADEVNMSEGEKSDAADLLESRTEAKEEAFKVPHDHCYSNKKDAPQEDLTLTETNSEVLDDTFTVPLVLPITVTPSTDLPIKVAADANGQLMLEMDPGEMTSAITTDPAPLILPPEVLQYVLQNEAQRRAEIPSQMSWCIVKEHKPLPVAKAIPEREDKPIRRLKCHRCYRKFRHPRGLQDHQLDHATQDSVCDKCGEVCPSLHDLKTHLRTHKRKTYTAQCNLCQKVVSRNKFKEHMVRHGEPHFECQTCDKKFFFEASLVRHTWKHTGVKPHLCDTCGKTFSTLDKIRRHLTTHTSPQHGQCEKCNVQFMSLHHKKVHKRWHSIQEERCGLRCDACSLDFTSLEEYSEHMKTSHAGNASIECDICKKQFKNEGALSHHMQWCHIQPLQCPICDRRLATKPTLKVHIENHKLGKARTLRGRKGHRKRGSDKKPVRTRRKKIKATDSASTPFVAEDDAQ